MLARSLTTYAVDGVQNRLMAIAFLDHDLSAKTCWDHELYWSDMKARRRQRFRQGASDLNGVGEAACKQHPRAEEQARSAR